jgi:hypothetical protein
MAWAVVDQDLLATRHYRHFAHISLAEDPSSRWSFQIHPPTIIKTLSTFALAYTSTTAQVRFNTSWSHASYFHALALVIQGHKTLNSTWSRTHLYNRYFVLQLCYSIGIKRIVRKLENALLLDLLYLGHWNTRGRAHTQTYA